MQKSKALVTAGVVLAVAGLASFLISRETPMARRVVAVRSATGLAPPTGPIALTPTDAAMRAKLESSIRGRVSAQGQYRRIDSLEIKRTTLGQFIQSGGSGIDLAAAGRMPAWANTRQAVYVVLTAGLIYFPDPLPSGEAPTPAHWDVQVWTTALDFPFSEDALTTIPRPTFFDAIEDTTG
jgi:hypothetical protein